MTEQPAYYSILTASVRYDPRLKNHADEKILFSEITALTNKLGYCTASNRYFAELYDRPVQTISKWINHLKSIGYLKIEMVREGKEIKQRKIYTNTNPPINADVNTPSRSHEGGIHVNVKDPIHVDVKENITSINNTSINNNNNKGVEKQTTVNAFETLQKANISLNGITTPIFLDYVESLGNEVVDYAINKMCSSATRASWGYLKVMLNDYEEHNVKTLEQIKKLEADFEAKKEKRVFRKKKVVQKEALPDWAANPPEQSVQAKPNEYTDEQRAELTAKLARLSEKGKLDGTNEC